MSLLLFVVQCLKLVYKQSFDLCASIMLGDSYAQAIFEESSKKTKQIIS